MVAGAVVTYAFTALSTSQSWLFNSYAAVSVINLGHGQNRTYASRNALFCLCEVDKLADSRSLTGIVGRHLQMS